MNKLLKFKQTDTQKHYFCSDTHYNHNPKWDIPLWKRRGYTDVNSMNRDIIEKINGTVLENDVLWHIGDITLNCTEEQFENFIGQIVCKNIYLLWGNHNSPSWQIYQRQVSRCLPNDDSEVYPFVYKNLIFVGNYQEILVDGQYIVMAHYPISVFNHMKDGAWHLCGHSHYSFDPSTAENLDSKILDVGWEGKLGVYSMEDLRLIMNEKGMKVVDHHGA